MLSKLSYWLPFQKIVNSPLYLRYKGIRAQEFIPFGIDLDIFRPNPEVRNLGPNDDIIVGCIGRSELSKGLVYILEAFKELHAADGRFRLRVAYGNLPAGWTHPALEIVVPKNDRDLSDFYRSLDVLVAAGIVQHGAPHYPVLEGMACGVPVVHTGYMPGDDESTWKIASKSAQSIRDQVMAVVADSSRMAKTRMAIERTKAFEWAVVSSNMMSLLEAGRHGG